MKNLLLIAFLMTTTLGLNACGTTQGGAPNPYYNDAKNAQSSSYKPSMYYDRNEDKSLNALESMYKKNADSESHAIDYAIALRSQGFYDVAEVVLAPYAKEKNASTNALSEYAALKLSEGKNKTAERYAQRAVKADENNYHAFHRLGIALDAQGKHKPAERAYRKGLDMWQGDPTSIMNNLALNLASQKFLSESIDILRAAQDISPDRLEIERNLRIVTALQQAEGAPAPKPGRKPEFNKEEA